MNSTHSIRTIAALAASTCAIGLAVGMPAATAAPLTAQEVAKKYDDELRHDALTAKLKLSTCGYKVEQSQMRCTERPRERVVENVAKSYGRDIRTIGILAEPISDRGIGMLGWQYWDKNKVNDYWMYLPALGKVKRVLSVKDSADSGSYFGTEFFMEDLEEPRLEEYSFRLMGEENVRVLQTGKGYVEIPAYVLEWLPVGHKKEISNYARSVTWIDKERFILLRGEYYDQDGRLNKVRTIKNLQQVDHKWLPRQVTMDNLLTRRVSVMHRPAIALNISVDDEYLSQRSLTDQAFRERYLVKFRTLWKE
jgi:hypothetical protein